LAILPVNSNFRTLPPAAITDYDAYIWHLYVARSQRVFTPVTGKQIFVSLCYQISKTCIRLTEYLWTAAQTLQLKQRTCLIPNTINTHHVSFNSTRRLSAATSGKNFW